MQKVGLKLRHRCIIINKEGAGRVISKEWKRGFLCRFIYMTSIEKKTASYCIFGLLMIFFPA